MPSRSQRHLREIYGVDSGGNTSLPPSLVEGYLFATPNGTLTTSGSVTDVTLFDGVASEIHNIGGPSAAVPTLVGGWNDPDNIFRRLFGTGVTDLCRADNLEGSVLYSTFVDAKGVTVGPTDTILSLALGLTIDTYSLRTATDFRELRTKGLCLDDSHMTKLFDAGEQYPLPTAGNGSWGKANDLFHVGIVVNKFQAIGNWVDLWFEGNVVMGELLSSAMSAYAPDPVRGITMWADMPDARNNGTAFNTNQAQLMNRDLSSKNKTHSLLIKRFGSDQTDLIPAIMAEHYRDRTTMPVSAL